MPTKSKLYQALKDLNFIEWGQFNAFVNSPYFNVNESIIRLHGALFSMREKLETAFEQKEVLYREIYAGPFDDLRLRHLFSDYLKLFEHFVAVRSFESESHKIDAYKLDYYRERGLTKHFSNIERRLRSQLGDSREFESHERFYEKYQLERALNNLYEERHTRRGVTNFEALSESLDHYFILQKLRYGCMQLNYKNVYSKGHQLFLLDEIINYVEKHDFSAFPLIRAYYSVLMLFKEPKKKLHYKRLTEVLDKNYQRFELDVNRELYKYAQNFCIAKVNSGESEFFKELFRLYKTSIERNIVFEGGEISPLRFKNIVFVACRLKQMAWAEKFIEENGQFIPEEHQHSSININTALLYWNKKDYPNALRRLSMVEYDDPFYALDAKSLMLKIYYELQEVDNVLSLCDSFKIYLRRNKLVSAKHKDNYQNLIRYVSKLIKTKPGQLNRVQNLKTEIGEAKGVNNKEWLMEKVQELETRMAQKV